MDVWNNKSFTMQPDNKIMKYFKSLKEAQANYENIPKSLEQSNQSHHHQTMTSRHHPHTLYHSRSHSQHYHNAMILPPDCTNNYCNLTPHFNAPYPRISLGNRSRQSPLPPVIDQPIVPMHLKRAQLDSMTVMRLGAELGVLIDAAPQMPPPRKYSIIESRNGHLYKLYFPHARLLATDVIDPQEDIFIRKADSVTVLGPSNEDRSKFTICYKKGHIEVPHLYTKRPLIAYSNWQVH